MSVCTKSHDCHVIFLALETLLGLIEMPSQSIQVAGPPNTLDRGSCLLQNVAKSVTSDSNFITVGIVHKMLGIQVCKLFSHLFTVIVMICSL